MNKLTNRSVRLVATLLVAVSLSLAATAPASAYVRYTGQYYMNHSACVSSAEWYVQHGWTITQYCTVVASTMNGVAYEWHSLFQRG